MANFEIVALDPTTPQLRAPGASDAYSLPRPINGANINYAVLNVSSAFTLSAFYNGRIINCTANSFTITFPSASMLDAGFNCWINNNGTGTITLSGTGSIDGFSSIILRPGEGIQIYGEGAGDWQVLGKKAMRAYAENMASATRAEAQASGSVAVGNNALASGVYSLALGYSTASGLASVAVGGYGTKSLASGSYSTAIGLNSTASGAQAIGSGAVALNGSYAATADSFAASITTNTSTYGATGTSAVAMAYRARASNSNGLAIGYTAAATGFYSVALGANASASGSGSFAFGSIWNLGYGAVAGGIDSFAFGDGSRAIEAKKYAFAGWASGGYLQQFGVLVLSYTTSNATPVALSSNNSTATSHNQLILQAYSAYAFTGTVVARQTGSTSTAAWKIEGLIRRESTAGSTTLVASTVTVISNAPGWGLSLSADTTNGGLAVTATGAAATNIRWVGNLQTSEVTYP
jgi:hypothetical protein